MNKITKQEYNFMVEECSSNNCYNCYCNSTELCFKQLLEKIIKDFPRRHYEELKIKEIN